MRIESDIFLLCLAHGDNVEIGNPIDVSSEPDDVSFESDRVSVVDSARGWKELDVLIL